MNDAKDPRATSVTVGARVVRAPTVGVLAVEALAVGALGAGLVTVLTVCTSSTWAAATTAHAPVGALLAVVALALGWLLALRLVAATVAAAVSLVPGALGTGGRAVAGRLTPALVRRLVHAVVGATVAAGPLATGGASWAAEPNAGLPILDRVASVPAAGPSTAVGPSAAVGPTRPPAPPRVMAPATAPRLIPASAAIIVQRGDSLWRIAARQLPAGHTDEDVAKAWPRWYAANRAVIGADPSAIRPGQRLVAPAPDSGVSS